MSGIMSMLLGAVSSAAAAVDEFFNRVTLLLPGNGTNGAQNNTFLDSSTNNFTITRNGNTTQGTFSPFSQTGWGNFFNGSSDYLSFSDNAAFELGSGDFTLEAWVNFSALPASNGHQATIFSKWGGGTSQSYELYLYNNAGTQQLYFTYSLNSTTSTNVGVNWTPTVGVWYHVACVRSGSNLYFFVNGTQQGSTGAISGTIADNASTLQIGTFNNTANTFLNGYLSSARMTKGGALYTNTFTPSTTPLTTTVSAGTVSLLTCQSNRFIDNSSNAFAITVNGNPSVQAFSPFAPTAAYSAATVGGSGFFDGTGDNLSAAANDAFQFGTGNFCVEAWVYITNTATVASGRRIFSKYSFIGSSNYGMILQVFRTSGNSVEFELWNAAGVSQLSLAANPTLVGNAWYHLAVARNGANASLYVNGSRLATSSSAGSANDNWSTAVTVGSQAGADASTIFQGYISSARMVKGSSIYDPTLTTLTVPTAPLTAVTNTSLLLNFTNAGITDATAKNDLETVGNAQISTTQSKFGGSSIFLDGTGDWLFARYNPNLELGSGDFTVEAWVYFSTLPSNAAAAIVSYGDSDNTPRWLLYYDSRTGTANGLRFTVIDGSGSAIILVEGGGTSGWAANTWYHVAVTRSGNSWRLFRDGTQTGSTLTDTDAIPAASNNGLVVGAEPNGSIPLTGYIDDLRVTKGHARYTSNFTAPTSAFPTQ